MPIATGVNRITPTALVTGDTATVAKTTATLTNMDVEMQEAYPVIVLDTNVLLEFLDTIQNFVSDVEEQRLTVMIIIPGVVIHELDALKNRDRLSWIARRASTWLLKKVKEGKVVRGQALNETCRSSGNWKVRERGEEFGKERENDGSILDCCQYFARGGPTTLCSKDKLLAVEAESVGIATFPNQGSFCSLDLAESVFGPGATTLQSKDEDGMDVDDESAVTEFDRPSHPLDQLHLQVIEHFGELLQELVAKVAGSEAARFGADMTSIHAPGYTRRPLRFWTTTDSLEYLNAKKACPQSSPRVEVFLRRPYGERGGRRGQEWSRRDWEVALRTLGSISDLWAADGAAIGESVRALLSYLAR